MTLGTILGREIWFLDKYSPAPAIGGDGASQSRASQGRRGRRDVEGGARHGSRARAAVALELASVEGLL